METFLRYTDYLMLFWMVRMFFVLRMYRYVLRREGADFLEHYHGVFFAIMKFWVWTNYKALRRKDYDMFAFKKL
jgi:hypothetical protein